mgnify:CR=1 FL=1
MEIQSIKCPGAGAVAGTLRLIVACRDGGSVLSWPPVACVALITAVQLFVLVCCGVPPCTVRW